MSVSTGAPRALLLRAIVSFVILPGTVGFLVPLSLARAEGARIVQPAAAVLLLLGIVVLLWCVRAFYVHGRGTLAPWDPPTSLVVRGLYRFSRNPMYVGVLLILFGWAALFGSVRLAAYAIVIAVVFHIRVVWFEEPWLSRTYPQAWREYSGRVRRWL